MTIPEDEMRQLRIEAQNLVTQRQAVRFEKNFLTFNLRAFQPYVDLVWDKLRRKSLSCSNSRQEGCCSLRRLSTSQKQHGPRLPHPPPLTGLMLCSPGRGADTNSRQQPHALVLSMTASSPRLGRRSGINHLTRTHRSLSTKQSTSPTRRYGHENAFQPTKLLGQAEKGFWRA
jgi:hypothetical protein